MSNDQTITLTCIGMRELASGGLGQGWQDPNGNNRFWRKPLVQHAKPGDRYTVTGTFEEEKLEIYTSGSKSPVFLDRLEGPQVDDWYVQDKGAKYRAAQEKASKKADRDLIKDSMLPLRQAMARVRNWEDRAALAAMVAAELNRPLTKEESK